MAVRLLQPAKATIPMLVTLEGIIVFLHPATNVLVAVSMMALQLFRESYTLFAASTWMAVKLLQPQNAASPMLVTLEGMVMEVRPLQSWKALFPMLVTDFGMLMEVKPLQPQKAKFPMHVTELGMMMAVKLLQPSNAPSPMLVTL